MNSLPPIGVFDSGIGGLTVLRALHVARPDDSFIYLGDTARLPYGTKTAATVERYALQAVAALVARGVRAVVVACNTASAAALPALRATYPKLPILGVIEPGAAAAVAATRNNSIAVIATEGTVAGGAYDRAIHQLLPQAKVHSIATSLFVALAEEGWVEGEVAEAVARKYLAPLWSASAFPAPDTLVLGCTHFPPLAKVIRQVIGENVTIVDSAATTAAALAKLLPRVEYAGDSLLTSRLQFLVTDGELRFQKVGKQFLGEALDSAAVQRIDL